MQYDTTNTGAIFTKMSEYLELIGTGFLDDEGEDKRIIMTTDTLPDGTKIRDIYLKVGRLWDNESTNPHAPTFTGVCQTSTGEKRVAAWFRETENNGIVLSMKLTSKRNSSEDNSAETNIETDV